MRINGFTQIKSFYSWIFNNQDKQVKPQHISLYLFLLNQNNRVNWIEWFKCPYDLAMAGSCISSKKTYYKCLNDLKDWGLVDYIKGTNLWKSPLIKLEVLKDTSTVPQSEPQGVPQQLPLPTQVDEPLLTLLPTHIYKLITDNHKLVTDNLKRWITFFSENNEVSNTSNSQNKNESKEKLFDDWWNMYDHKKDAANAKKKFLKLKDSDIEALLKATPKYVASTPDKKYRRLPTTFLNGRNWEDEYSEPTPVKQKLTF